MIHSILLAAQATVPATPEWSFATALVMIICNAIGLALAAFRTPAAASNKTPSPVPGLSFPQLLAGTSFGHVLGAGAILGLTNIGVL